MIPSHTVPYGRRDPVFHFSHSSALSNAILQSPSPSRASFSADCGLVMWLRQEAAKILICSTSKADREEMHWKLMLWRGLRSPWGALSPLWVQLFLQYGRQVAADPPTPRCCSVSQSYMSCTARFQHSASLPAMTWSTSKTEQKYNILGNTCSFLHGIISNINTNSW